MRKKQRENLQIKKGETKTAERYKKINPERSNGEKINRLKE